jgi:dihydroxy-acid dehydratase
MRPTAMLFRNLLAMEVEESIRGNPIDGVVLLGGCDKTTPGQVMGACSVGLPFLVISSGPMLNGKYRGRDIGSGTDVWKLSEAVRAGALSLDDFLSAERCMSRSHGTCMTMGTASTMACLIESMGLSLPYNGTIPAVDAHRKALAHESGRRIVQMVHNDETPSRFLTRKAFENAIVTTAAIGGSTNSVVHLLAMAGRMGVPLSLDDWAAIGADVPLLVDLMPSGRFLMEEFHYAGGLPAVLKALSERIHLDVPTVAGVSLGEQIASAVSFSPEVIRTTERPVQERAGIAVLRGNICPNGAIIKPSAASASLLKHTGQAVVFSSIEELKARIDDPALSVDKDSVLVLKGCGPKGYPGMPEVGNMPLPQKLLKEGVTDMVRLSDARMSGTAFGTVVLHIAPESAVGGPFAFIRDGDTISLDVEAGTLDVLLSDEELAQRKAEWKPEQTPYTRGYYKLYQDTVLQADQGADLDFLVGASGHVITRESH